MMDFEAVLTFWFEELDQSQWWIKSAELDEQIKTRFSSTLAHVINGETYQWRQAAKGRLAEVIVLDQFSRNIFRDTPGAFSQDPQALTLAQEAINQGADQHLEPLERHFLYMPYMHSESLAMHEQAVTLYTSNGIESFLEFELKHKVIIDRFGRYPHRNDILGRVSTEEELVFLQQPESGF